MELCAQGGAGGADGCQQGNVYGCYLPGLFDSPEVNRALVAALLEAKGLDASAAVALDMAVYKQGQYDALAAGVRGSLDMELVYRIIEEGL
jgi:adenosylcobyric acid synthase